MKILVRLDTKSKYKLICLLHFNKQPKRSIIPPEFRLKHENENKLEIEDVSFAFEQAEKQLEGSIQEADILLSRTSVLLTIILGFIASIIGFLISEIEKTESNSVLIITAITAIIYLSFPSFKLFENFKGHKYQSIGSQPALLLDEYYVITIPDKNKREVAIKIKEIKSYQLRINHNNATNERRWRKFNYSLKGMIYFPFFLTSIYIIIKILFVKL